MAKISEQEYEVYKDFFENQDDLLRVRYHIGNIHDEIRPAMLRSKLITLGYNKNYIKELCKKKILATKTINYKASNQVVVLYLGQSLTDHTWYKRWWRQLAKAVQLTHAAAAKIVAYKQKLLPNKMR